MIEAGPCLALNWTPGVEPTNPRSRRLGNSLEKASEEGGEAQDAFKDVIDDNVDKDFKDFQYIL